MSFRCIASALIIASVNYNLMLPEISEYAVQVVTGPGQLYDTQMIQLLCACGTNQVEFRTFFNKDQLCFSNSHFAKKATPPPY